MQFPSKYIENAVLELSRLPGIGKKSALRLALYLLNNDQQQVENLSDAILTMKNQTSFCSTCHNVADVDACKYCDNPSRNTNSICVVEGIKDVIAIENTNQFNGLYHVLGGIISPIDGVGPDDLNIQSLLKRIEKEETREVIMALNPTIEGDTTVFYISKLLHEKPIKISTIARGIAFGGELEYADEMTLGRSILARTAYNQPIFNE